MVPKRSGRIATNPVPNFGLESEIVFIGGFSGIALQFAQARGVMRAFPPVVPHLKRQSRPNSKILERLDSRPACA